MDAQFDGGRGTNRGYDTSRPAGSFVEVVREVLLNPLGFFAGLGAPGPGRIKGPLIFAVVCAYVSAPLMVLGASLSERLDPLTPQGSAPFAGFLPLVRESPGVAALIAASLLVLLPLFAVLGVYVGAAIQHLFVLIFMRQRRGFWGTLPVVAYGASALSLLAWIPILGYLVNVYGIYVTAMGLKELHGATTTRALLAALVPYLLGFTLLIPAVLLAPPGAP